jgi:hypothetical protein
MYSSSTPLKPRAVTDLDAKLDSTLLFAHEKESLSDAKQNSLASFRKGMLDLAATTLKTREKYQKVKAILSVVPLSRKLLSETRIQED